MVAGSAERASALSEVLGRLRGLRARHQADVVAPPAPASERRVARRFVLRKPDLSLAELLAYDFIVVAFSGGKDSLAALLYLLALGVPAERIELWHHLIDGREGSTLMDWPVTEDYCRRVAEALGVRIYMSWKEGGFEREMRRNNSASAPSWWEGPDGALATAGGDGDPGTRQQYPQVSADLNVRWCSAYLKIDVMAIALRNQARFQGRRTLVVTGERAEESTKRGQYERFEPHRADLRHGRRYTRHIDHWRPVQAWSEADVWAIIAHHRIAPHPAYRIGMSRVSCAACIFSDKHQLATLLQINPRQFWQNADHERDFGKSIKRNIALPMLAAQGTPYPMDPADVRAVLSRTFDEPVFVDDWQLPRGAYGSGCGPT